MATYRSGATSRIVIGEEDSYGAGAAVPIGHIIRKASFTFEGIKELIENPELRSDPNPAPDATGLETATGQMTMPVSADEFGLILYWFLAYGTPTGAGPYAHPYTVEAGTNPASLWVEVGDTALTKYDKFYGMYIQSISLGTITKQSQMLIATINFHCSGSYSLNEGTPEDATPDEYTDKLHTMPAISVEVDTTATTIINEISHTMSRNIQGNGVLDSTLYFTDANLQKYSYDCTIKGWRDSSDTIFGYDDGNEHVVEIISPRPGEATRSVEIKHGEAFIFNSEGSGGVSDDGPTFAVARVRPHYVDGADGSSILCTVNSDIADYSAIV